MTADAEPRRWSELTEDQRDRLLAAYQSVMAAETGSCSFEVKLRRMQAWLGEQGISITEDEIRRPRRVQP